MHLEAIVKNLHSLNFGKDELIEFAPDEKDYNFKRFIEEEKGTHGNKKITVCRKCGGCDLVQEDGTRCVFTRITHGTHTLDFLDAHGVDHDTVVAWSQKPVLFVMENPGAVDGGDLQLDCGRYISGRWYWVMGQYGEPNGKFFYPQYFVQKEYGWMIYSVIRTFKMANAYVTNMVKCGMVSEEEKSKKNYLTTDEYPNGIAQKCVENYLKREINCLRGENKGENVIAFAFGERTYYHLKEALKDDLKSGKISLYLLPHPANRLANDYRKYVLFGKISRALLQNHFYDGVKEKPDFEAILAADTYEEPKESREEACIALLKEIERDIVKSKEYKEAIGYEITHVKGVNGVTSDELETLVLRQMVNGKKVWVRYWFLTNTDQIEIACRTTGRWSCPEDKNFPAYQLIEKFAEKYQEKYGNANSSEQE